MTTKEKIKALVDEVISKDYGATIDHVEIACIIEEPIYSQKYRQIVASAKKHLEKSGKMITNIRGVGYRVVAPDEYTDESVSCVDSGIRKIKRGAEILDYAPVKDMTQSGVQRYNAIADPFRKLNAFVCGAKVEIKMLNAKREHPLKAALKT